MKPAVAQVIRLDTYRDGGSLSIDFCDSLARRFQLFFKIDAIDANHYSSAILNSFTEKSYTSPVTGDTMPLPQNVESESLPWEEVVNLLEDIGHHMEGIESDYKWVYQVMMDVAKNNGTSRV